MGFQVVNLPGGPPGHAQSLGQQLFLGAFAGQHHAGTACVLIDRGAANHTPHPIAVRHRVGETLEDENPAPFPADEAVRRVGKRRAPSGRRNHRQCGHRNGGLFRQRDVDPCRECDVHISVPKCLDGLIHRHQRGGTVHVNGHRGPFGAQGLRQTRGGEAARRSIVVDRNPGRRHQFAVFRVADPRIDAGDAACQRLGGDTGILQGMPANLEQHALLGIERARLNGNCPEEGGVETVQVPHKRTAERRGEPGRYVPGGHRAALLDGRAAGFKKRPEFLKTVGVRKAARHPHDRDPLVRRPHRLWGRRGDDRRRFGLGRRCRFTGQLPGQVPGHGLYVRMVEHDRARHLIVLAEGPVDTVLQFHSHQRIDTQIGEGGLGIGRLRQAEQRLQFLPQESCEHGHPPLWPGGLESRPEIGCAFLNPGSCRLPLAAGDHVRKERLFAFKAVGVGCPVDRGHDG